MYYSEFVDVAVLVVSIVNFVLATFLMIETLITRKLKKEEELKLALERSDSDEVSHDDFDNRIERMKAELYMQERERYEAIELHPGVKNIPHEEVAHHVQKHVKDEVSE